MSIGSGPIGRFDAPQLKRMPPAPEGPHRRRLPRRQSRRHRPRRRNRPRSRRRPCYRRRAAASTPTPTSTNPRTTAIVHPDWHDRSTGIDAAGERFERRRGRSAWQQVSFQPRGLQEGSQPGMAPGFASQQHIPPRASQPLLKHSSGLQLIPCARHRVARPRRPLARRRHRCQKRRRSIRSHRRHQSRRRPHRHHRPHRHRCHPRRLHPRRRRCPTPRPGRSGGAARSATTATRRSAGDTVAGCRARRATSARRDAAEHQHAKQPAAAHAREYTTAPSPAQFGFPVGDCSELPNGDHARDPQARLALPARTALCSRSSTTRAPRSTHTMSFKARRL